MTNPLIEERIETGEENYRAVRAYMSSHLCATQRECAKALNLSVMAVNRHVARIREEWMPVNHERLLTDRRRK